MPDEQTIRKAIDTIINDSGVADDILEAAEEIGLNPMEIINRFANELKMRVM